MQRRKQILTLILLSLILVLTISAAASAAPTVGAATASQTAPADGKDGYLGSIVCKGCHTGIHETVAQTLHPWKVRPKADANIVGDWPHVWDGVTYTQDDFDWVIGAHPKWKQRYIKIQDDGKWAILPFQWNIETQEYVAYNHAGDYRDDCAGCHTTGYDVTTKTWKEPGVWCEACHGPGGNHLANIGNPPGERGIYAKPDPEVCGSCHTRGKTKDGMYNWPEGYVPGGDVHLDDIWNVTTDPGKWWFDNPEDENDPFHAKSHHQQYPEWEASRHSKALATIQNSDHGSEACLGCHSDDYRRDPDNVTVETAEFAITCQTCHVNHEPGTVGSQLVKEPYALCIECHNGHLPDSGKFAAGADIHHPMQEMFEGIGFPGVADMPSAHFQDDAGATCSSCHMPKTAKSAITGDITSHRFAIAMPGDVKDGEPDSCTGCHSNASQEQMQNVIDTRQEKVMGQLAALKQLGMDNACGDFDAGLADGASDECKTAFTAYKFVHEEGSFGLHNYPYAQAVLKQGFDALGGVVNDRPYVGSETCAACHGDKHESNLTTLHPWKVRPKEEANIVGQFPMEWDGVTYTEDSFDWVIGAHPKWKQRYIDIQDDGKWAILPFQWNMATQEFAPYSHAGDYREDCAGCHTTGLDVDLFGVAEIPWNEPGVTCESCHGPGLDHIQTLDADKGQGEIYRSVDAEVCAGCHVRGKTKDGLYSWPEGYVPGGDVHVADVFDYTNDASKWWFDNPDDPDDPGHAKSHHQQSIEYERSAHANSLAVIQGFGNESCLECHSEDYRRDPDNVTMATAEQPITCVTCHESHNPGVDGSSQLIKPPYETCVQCHNGHLPEEGKFEPGTNVHHPMQEVFEGIGFPGIEDVPSAHFQSDAGAACNSCHMPKTAKSAIPGDIASHLLKVVMPGDAKDGETDSCTGCHTTAGKDQMQMLIDDRQAEVKAGLDELNAAAMAAGCPDLSGDTAGDPDNCKLAFTAYKTVMSEGSFGIHNYYYDKAILNAGMKAFDQPVYELPYVGSETCATCHKDYYDSNLQTLHPWKVRPKAEANIVGDWPVEWEGVTYTLDQVDWIIGAHPKWKQRYIDIQDDGKWQILPFQWNMETQAFAPYSHGGDYRPDCAGCHTTGLDVNLLGQVEIPWSEPGITCESCHGPGLDHVLAPDKANDPKIYRSLDSEVCGSCHTRGKTKDGLYSWPEGYTPGGDVHIADIYDVTTDPSKWWFDNEDDPDDPGHAKSHHQQYPEWERSKHSEALATIQNSSHGSDHCLDCHSEDYRRDTEGVVTVETAQNTIECVTCHATHDPGEPGTSQLLMSQYPLCTQCHNGTAGGTDPILPGDSVHHPMQEMYEGRGMPGVDVNPSRHFLASDEGGGPVCSSCHFARTAKSATWINYDDGAIKKGDIASHLLIPVQPGHAKDGEPTACSLCHNWGATALQGIIDMRQADTQAQLDELDEWLIRLTGVDADDVNWAHTAFTFVESDGSTGFHNRPYAEDILNTAIDMVDGYKFLYLPTLLR